jgi:hypothetical protein
MSAALVLSHDSRTTAGILLLTVLAVEVGGLTVLRVPGKGGRHEP